MLQMSQTFPLCFNGLQMFAAIPCDMDATRHPTCPPRPPFLLYQLLPINSLLRSVHRCHLYLLYLPSR
jgi:hypothetical protein